MTMSAATTTTTSTSFPIGSSVLLQNLINGSQFNDKKGIVKSILDVNSGRQEVYVFEAQKSMAIKPINLRYEPRELSSLSISEMKGLLRIYYASDDENKNAESSGMDKQELRKHVLKVIGETIGNDPVKIAELVAKSNEPNDNLPSNSSNNNASPSSSSSSSSSLNSSQLRQGAERMSQMSPDDIRRQAATMKAMGPAALRAMNPQMAHMSDEQINMAIAQMEAVANDPNQLKMAAEQMKNMSEADLRRAMNLGGGGGAPSSSTSSTATSNASSSTRASTPSSSSSSSSIPPAIPQNISKTQFEQAAQQMSSLSPSQLRQQASMLRSVPYDTLRKTNPPMAHMTDAQIETSIQQLEQMAENPSLMQMAAEQMKSMTEEQYESMKQMLGVGGAGGGGAGGAGGGGGTSSSSSTSGATNAPIDPSNIMEGLLSNPDQLNSMIRTMKQNPELLKSVLSSQLGGGSSSDAAIPSRQKEQLNKAIDSFVQMDDEKLEKYLKLANGVQRMAKPLVTTLDSVKKRTGLSTRVLIVMIVVGMLAVFGIAMMKLWMWWNQSTRDGGTAITEEEEDSGMIPELLDDANSEF